MGASGRRLVDLGAIRVRVLGHFGMPDTICVREIPGNDLNFYSQHEWLIGATIAVF